ncbi:MAG: DMT family transporter [Chloroflexota bacterium]
MDRRALLLFVLVSLLWGMPYFLIKVALHDLSPAMVSFVRVVIGAVTLLPIMLASGRLGYLRQRFGWIVLLSIVEVALPFTLIATGEQRISSSLTGILIATEPAFVALLASRFDVSERVRRGQLGGLLLGLLGVIILLGLGLKSGSGLTGAVMVLLATLSYAVGVLLIKWRFSDVSPVGVVAATLALGALILAVPAAVSIPHTVPSARTIEALLVLGPACTGLGFLVFFALIARVGAGRAAVITYVTPAVAVLLGVVVGGEPFTHTTGAGLLLVLLGSWLATRGRPAVQREPLHAS